MSKTKQVEAAPETPEAIRIAAGYATREEVVATRIVSKATLDRIEDGEAGVNTGTLDDLDAFYERSLGTMAAGYYALRRAKGAA